MAATTSSATEVNIAWDSLSPRLSVATLVTAQVSIQATFVAKSATGKQDEPQESIERARVIAGSAPGRESAHDHMQYEDLR